MTHKEYLVQRLAGSTPIPIDGAGNSPAWAAARALDDFSFPWLDAVAPATRFRALWDSQYFYFFFEAADADIVLAQGADAKERVIGSDRVEIFFATGHDLQPYYGLEIDPRGEVLDYRGRYHRLIEWDWSCAGLEFQSRQNAQGYTVEGRIALTSLQQLDCLHEDEKGQYLIAGLFRAEFSHDDKQQTIQNWIAWVDPQVADPDFHVPSAFGHLRLS